MVSLNCSRFEEAIEIINHIDENKFTQLLTTLVQRVVLGVDAAEPFTNDELTKLEKSFGLNTAKVETLVAGSLEFLSEAAYHCVSPQLLSSILQKYPLEESKRSAILEVWKSTAVVVLGALKDRSLLPKLSFVSHTISHGLDPTSGGNDQAFGNLILGTTGGEKCDTLHIQFKQEELSSLLRQLNRIQLQLDVIAKE